MKRMLLVPLLAGCCALPALAADFRSVDTATVLYDAPSQRSRKLFVIKRGTPVEQVVNLEAWAKIRDAEGGLAWIEKKYLTGQRTVIVTAERAEIREHPDAAAPLVFSAEQKVSLEYQGTVSGAWIKVRHRDGQSGYVRAGQVWGI